MICWSGVKRIWIVSNIMVFCFLMYGDLFLWVLEFIIFFVCLVVFVFLCLCKLCNFVVRSNVVDVFVYVISDD